MEWDNVSPMTVVLRTGGLGGRDRGRIRAARVRCRVRQKFSGACLALYIYYDWAQG